MERVYILGLGTDNATFEDAVNFAEHNGGQVVTLNPEMIEYANKNPYFAEIINDAELVIPDGIGVQLGLKVKGYNIRRIAGIDFAKEVLTRLKNAPVAFVGAKPQVVKDAVKNLKYELEGINAVYVQDGYFQDDTPILEELKNKKPRLILVALGSPKQEEFIYKLKNSLPDTLMIGVGGSFDVWAGAVERAPQIYRKLGLEWLYRTVKEPQRFKRIFPTLPLFMLKVLKEKWS